MNKRNLLRALMAIGAVLFVTFWAWALFFASKEAVNRIGDRGWAERAQAICEQSRGDLEAIADYRTIVDASPTLIGERADLVDQSTDILEAMLDQTVAVGPTDDKGIAIVPKWESEYRTFLDDRHNYATQLRDSGQNLAFYETEVGGLPISERLETFAGDNEMPACAPPRDLSR